MARGQDPGHGHHSMSTQAMSTIIRTALGQMQSKSVRVIQLTARDILILCQAHIHDSATQHPIRRHGQGLAEV